MSNQTRQQKYRRRMQEQGCKQYAFWLDAYAQKALKLLRTYDAANPDLSTVVNEAIRHYHAYKLSQNNTKPVTSDTRTVASDNRKPVTSDSKLVTSVKHKPITSDSPKPVTRYMPLDLESYILDLRQSGLSLNEVSERLFNEGHRNAKGQPYSTGTLSKAETRAKARQSL